MTYAVLSDAKGLRILSWIPRGSVGVQLGEEENLGCYQGSKITSPPLFLLNERDEYVYYYFSSRLCWGSDFNPSNSIAIPRASHHCFSLNPSSFRELHVLSHHESPSLPHFTRIFHPCRRFRQSPEIHALLIWRFNTKHNNSFPTNFINTNFFVE